MTEKTEKPMIYGAMVKIMREISPIKKGDKNAQQGYNFRGIEAVYNSLHNLFSEFGVFIIPNVKKVVQREVTTKTGNVLLFCRVIVEYAFTAEDGSFIIATAQGEAMDSGDKALNKAMSAAQKYLLLQTFLIPTAEQKDADFETPPPIVSKKPTPPTAQPQHFNAADAQAKCYEHLKRLQDVNPKSAFFLANEDIIAKIALQKTQPELRETYKQIDEAIAYEVQAASPK